MSEFAAFEVSSILRVADEASAPMTRVLGLARDIEREFERLKTLGAGLFSGTGVGRFVAQLGRVDPALDKVAAQMTAMRDATVTALGDMGTAISADIDLVKGLKAEMMEVSAAARTMRMPIPVAGGGRGGGGGGGGIHATGNVPIVPGVHARTGLTTGMGAAAVLGYGMYEEAELQDAVAKILYTANATQKGGLSGPQYEQQKIDLRNRIVGFYKRTGVSLDQIEEATHAAIRLMAPLPLEQRESILDKVLPAAAMETKLKGGSFVGNTEAIVGLLHMSGFYKPEEIDKLVPAFTYAALYDPQNISSMVKAAGYAIPSLRTMTNLDPIDTLQAVALLQSAGVSSTKAGTWIERGVERLLPDVDPFSKKHAEHTRALQAFGLADEKGQSTIVGDHGILIGKALGEVSAHLQTMNTVEKASYLKELGGQLGARFLAMASDPIVAARSQQLISAGQNYGNVQGQFWEEYKQASPIQQARLTLADFNSALMDVAKDALPAATAALRTLDSVLKAINNIGDPTLRNTAQIGEMAALPAAGFGAWWALKKAWQLGKSAIGLGGDAAAGAAAAAGGSAAGSGAAAAGGAAAASAAGGFGLAPLVIGTAGVVGTGVLGEAIERWTLKQFGVPDPTGFTWQSSALGAQMPIPYWGKEHDDGLIGSEHAETTGNAASRAVPPDLKPHPTIGSAHAETTGKAVTKAIPSDLHQPNPTLPAPVGMISPGNLDPWHRKILHNPDGSYSTTSSISVGTDKGETIIPTVVDGIRLSVNDAIKRFRATGENFGTFDTAAHADVYATALHNAQAKFIEEDKSAPTSVMKRVGNETRAALAAIGDWLVGAQRAETVGDQAGKAAAAVPPDLKGAHAGIVASVDEHQANASAGSKLSISLDPAPIAHSLADTLKSVLSDAKVVMNGEIIGKLLFGAGGTPSVKGSDRGPPGSTSLVDPRLSPLYPALP